MQVRAQQHHQPRRLRRSPQPPADTDPFVELARLVVDLDRKDELLTQLGKRIEPLKPLQMVPVGGEIDLHQSLVDLLQRARGAIRELAAADPAAVDGLVAQLSEQLGDVHWDLLEETVKRLAVKQRQQDELLQRYKGQVDRHRVLVNQLRAALDNAARVHAPVRRDVELLRRLEARLMQADRTLVNFEQPFPILVETVKALEVETAPLDEALKTIQTVSQETERFVRNADLLLIQSPLDLHGRYQYEVAMRLAGEPGAHSGNVQGTVRLVQQDRELMQYAIKQITGIVTGRVRQQTPRRGRSQAVQPDAQPRPSEENEDVRGAIRAYIFGQDQSVVLPDAPLSSLVREMGDLMFRLFVPEEVENFLTSTTCSLTLATNDLELPWEFMYHNLKPDNPAQAPGAGEDEENFLCLNRPIARRLMGRPLPADRLQRLDRPAKRQFLFVANPTLDLSEAEREVDTVVASLEQNWKDQITVTVLRGKEATGRRLNQLLRAETFDVIHYSGHAFFDDNDPDYSGLLLYDREIFFAQKIRRLLGGRPLVFLNSCESARSANEERPASTLDYHLQKPAQGLAASFVYGGALGCLGSLWPINDQRAARFAIEFYNLVLDGHMIGEAMRRARVRIKSDSPNEITWAAFVLYGDPTY
nr:CHAT domain-containing protein [Caldilineaceae bacterium]